MNLDKKLTRLGLKLKHMIVLDVSFTGEPLKSFKSAYPKRYVHLPSHQDMVFGMAAGMATLGKLVLVIGSDREECNLPDNTLHVKILKRSSDAVWDFVEDNLRIFGTGVLLIPEDE
jgi:hypothetical protein